MHNTPDIAYEKGTKCMLGSFIDIYVLYTYLFRCDLQPCLPGLQVLLNHIFTRVNIRKASKEGKSLAFWIQFCRSLCIRARSFSYFSKCYLSVFLHCQVDNKEWHIYIYNIDNFKIFLFPMLWFNQEKIYFCHHLSCVF